MCWLSLAKGRKRYSGPGLSVKILESPRLSAEFVTCGSCIEMWIWFDSLKKYNQEAIKQLKNCQRSVFLEFSIGWVIYLKCLSRAVQIFGYCEIFWYSHVHNGKPWRRNPSVKWESFVLRIYLVRIALMRFYPVYLHMEFHTGAVNNLSSKNFQYYVLEFAILA